jgi:hypothetical protein
MAVLGTLGVAIATDHARFRRDFLRLFGLCSAAISLGVTAIMYEDVWGFRFAAPLLWWTVVFAAVALSRLRVATALPVPLAAAAAAVALLTYGAPHTPTLLTWRSPLAVCLAENGLRAGVADYWRARITEAGSDWAVHVGQITGRGAALVWGNDPLWFTHDPQHAGQPARFGFVVLDRLDPQEIAAAYGPPARRIACGESAVWVYDDPVALDAALRRRSPPLPP